MALSTVVVVATTVFVGCTRLFMFRSTVVPLTLVLPLLLCVWSRQTWQLWGMSFAFALMSAARAFWILPAARAFAPAVAWAYFGNNFVNLAVGALAVQAILAYRNRVDANTATISARNREIGSQTAILARQNEQIESQRRVLEQQNADLRGSNDRLRSREDILEMLLQSSRSQQIGSETLVAVCQRGLRIVGPPAAEIGIYELENGSLVLRARGPDAGGPRLPPPSPPPRPSGAWSSTRAGPPAGPTSGPRAAGAPRAAPSSPAPSGPTPGRRNSCA